MRGEWLTISIAQTPTSPPPRGTRSCRRFRPGGRGTPAFRRRPAKPERKGELNSDPPAEGRASRRTVQAARFFHAKFEACSRLTPGGRPLLTSVVDDARTTRRDGRAWTAASRLITPANAAFAPRATALMRRNLRQHSARAKGRCTKRPSSGIFSYICQDWLTVRLRVALDPAPRASQSLADTRPGAQRQ